MEPSEEAERVAEDDVRRSQFIRRLIQSDGQASSPVHNGSGSVPRLLVQFWDDLACVPEDVQECLDSWSKLDASGFQRVLFDDARARTFISERFDGEHVVAYDRCHHPAMRCDYFRLCFLRENGGFYVDADEVYQGLSVEELVEGHRLKLQPLCYDISTDSMVSGDVYRQPANTSPDWIYYVNNNPLIAPPKHPLIRSALDRATTALSRSDRPLGIQSTTGPGNMSASLVRHCLALDRAGGTRDFVLLSDWDSTSVSRWPLSYRNDGRNWRRWTPPGQ